LNIFGTKILGREGLSEGVTHSLSTFHGSSEVSETLSLQLVGLDRKSETLTLSLRPVGLDRKSETLKL
jgi:hypothetical protein